MQIPKMGTHKFMIFSALALIFILSVSECKLAYVLEVARHGAKYPSKNLISNSDSANLKGQLTGVGQRQQYLLGSYLHQDYIIGQQLISGKLNGRQVEIFSSSYQRSIDSAYAQAYGLFPNAESHTIPEDFPTNLLNPPFSIQQNLQKQEIDQTATPNYALQSGFQPPHIFLDDSVINYCPNYGLLYTQRLKQISKNLTTFQAQHQLEITKLSMIFNLSILQSTVPSISDLYDDIISTIYLGRDLPKEFIDYDLKSLRFISDYYRLMVESGNFGEILSTPLLRFIEMRFNEVKLRQNQKKMTIFTCHAQNINELQAILNLTSVQCLTQKWANKTNSHLNCMNNPDFASSLIFQVHENEETFSYDIKVKYNGQYAYLCERKSQSCPIDEFLERMSKYVHDDYEKQCGVTVSSFEKNVDRKQLIIEKAKAKKKIKKLQLTK